MTISRFHGWSRHLRDQGRDAATPASESAVCALCGCDRVELDEVVNGSRMEIGECSRCHHRWTRSLGPAPAVGVRRPRRVRVAGKEASAAA